MKKMFAVVFVILLANFPVLAQHHHAPPPVHKTTVVIHRPRGVRPIAPVHTARFVGTNYHTKFGRPFRFGYYYYGFRHNHWSAHYWDTRYGTYLYYDPFALAWYYWCAPHYSFYPVSYVPFNNYSFPYEPNPMPPIVPPPPPPQ